MRPSINFQRSRTVLIIASFLVAHVLGCSSDRVVDSTPDPADGAAIVFNPPNPNYAQNLGITGGPVTEEEAKSIAEAATGGLALSVEREYEDGTEIFEVEIQVESGHLDVEVRISDGAVMKIESDNEDEDEDEDEGDDDDEDEGDDDDGEDE